jgi:hypothetical protein
MADDINKKITIEVELEADQVNQNIDTLNKAIDSLLAKQQQLSAVGQQSSAGFDSISSKLDTLQKKLQDTTAQVNSASTALGSLNTSAKNAENTLASVTAQHQKNAKAIGDSTSKTKELGGQVAALDQSLTQQKSAADQGKSSFDGYNGSISKSGQVAQQLRTNINQTSGALDTQANAVDNSKSAFDAHRETMSHLKTSFDEIKDVSGIFGPSLQQAAQGFNAMKNGLSIVKEGLNGVGEAIKSDGFGFLLDILQQIFDYFIHTTKGSKMLGGALSAIGVVVNKVKSVVNSFMSVIINAFSHPIDTLKSLGKTIEQNLINRFKAFGVILDGIIHLDFKKMANGAAQALTGVTDATDKVVNAYNTVVSGAKNTASEMADAFKKGYDDAAHYADNFGKKASRSYKKVIQSSKFSAAGNDSDSGGSNQRGDNLTGASTGVGTISPGLQQQQIMPKNLLPDKAQADQSAKNSISAFKQVEDYAKQSAGKIAANALGTLTNSIQQQTQAKIAALEKDKANELNNSSLTSAQKLAIEQKYKQQEAQVKAKAFKEEQEASIAQAVINGALAITKGTAQTGILATLYVPTIIAETAAQVAKIAAQKPPAYASGGLHYTSDGKGGLLPGYSKTDNTNAFLRSGEGIVVSEAMQVPWARNLVSAINVGFGGRDFSIINPARGYAVGGIFTDGGDANRYYNQPVHDQKNLANSIAYQMINNFPPVYVDVKDINNQQNILAQTINRVNL